MKWFGPLVWDTNMLPNDIKIILNLEAFKKTGTDRVPDNCLGKLCKDYMKWIGFVTYVIELLFAFQYKSVLLSCFPCCNSRLVPQSICLLVILSLSL